MKKSIHLIILCTVLFLFPEQVTAETPEEKGKRIYYASESRRDDGYGDVQFDETIIVINRYGQEKRRDVKVKLMELPGKGDMGMITVIDPADSKGIISLLHTYKDEPDDMWIYIPQLRRVKRVTTQNKTAAFMGTEATNEDSYFLEPEKFTYKWIREEMYEGQMCDVIDRFPIEKTSGYKRQRVWIDQTEGLKWQKLESYNLNDIHIKTVYYLGYHKYEGYFWRWDEWYFVNHQTGRSTRALFYNWRFKTGLTKRHFSVNRLKRAR